MNLSLESMFLYCDLLIENPRQSGSAKDGVDFVGLETNLEFRPFETAKTIKVINFISER